jgi:3-oxoacyl-[acyl-carrier-protein] synthase II
VVITGIGVICPIGQTAAETWENAVHGVSGVSPITRFDPEGYETRFAGQVAGFDAAQLLGRKESRRMDRYTQFAVAAALQAREQAGLAEANVRPERIGTLIGTGMGGMETIDQGAETLFTNGPSRLSPFFVPMMLPNMASGSVAIATGAKGPNFATISACASSAHAIGEGTGMIRRGDVDLIFAGGGEAPVTRLGVAGFNAMSALSRRNDDPSRASRPFDAGRDGFVLAEGGAVLVLEERQHALDRGAEILGEVVGYATTDDANHIVQPGPGGEGAARAMRLALADADLEPSQIDYINAHGTSTQLNEKLETQAIKRAFGDDAYRAPISSTKSMTGHLLGAAGAVEAAISLFALVHQCVPPTINYETPDPDCDLDYVPNTARSVALRTVMSNSMGFGGHNVSLIFTRGDEQDEA